MTIRIEIGNILTITEPTGGMDESVRRMFALTGFRKNPDQLTTCTFVDKAARWAT